MGEAQFHTSLLHSMTKGQCPVLVMCRSHRRQGQNLVTTFKILGNVIQYKGGNFDAYIVVISCDTIFCCSFIVFPLFLLNLRSYCVSVLFQCGKGTLIG